MESCASSESCRGQDASARGGAGRKRIGNTRDPTYNLHCSSLLGLNCRILNRKVVRDYRVKPQPHKF